MREKRRGFGGSLKQSESPSRLCRGRCVSSPTHEARRRACWRVSCVHPNHHFRAFLAPFSASVLYSSDKIVNLSRQITGYCSSSFINFLHCLQSYGNVGWHRTGKGHFLIWLFNVPISVLLNFHYGLLIERHLWPISHKWQGSGSHNKHAVFRLIFSE